MAQDQKCGLPCLLIQNSSLKDWWLYSSYPSNRHVTGLALCTHSSTKDMYLKACLLRALHVTGQK